MNPGFTYLNGILQAEAVSLLDLAQAVGTPCYVYSHEMIVNAWKSFDEALGTHPHQICYAVKANSNLAVLNTLAQLGSGFDIVSGGELARVIAAGGHLPHVVFSGVGKKPEELAEALKQKIGCFNLESETELITLNQIAQHLNVKAPIAFRVNPDVDPKSHPYISTGRKENKFGVPIGEALRLYQQACELPHIHITGLACHIGSQITTLSPFIDALRHLRTLIESLDAAGIRLQHLNVGGGLGVRYQNEVPPSIGDYIEAIKQGCPPGLPLILEPGRAIVAQAGVLLTQILSLKSAGEKHFCIVDAGMNDLLRPTLYQAWQAILPLKQPSLSEETPQSRERIYDVVGPICESGDFLGKDRALRVSPGEILAISASGAYGFVMSSHYNSRPRAAEVMVKGKDFQIVRQRETLSALFENEGIWLK